MLYKNNILNVLTVETVFIPISKINAFSIWENFFKSVLYIYSQCWVIYKE